MYDSQGGPTMTLHPLEVVGVRVELPANQPVVLLKESAGGRYLPIWIGAVEASAIAFQQQGVQTPRPLTHDLLRDVIAALGGELTQVSITELRDDVFYAELVFSNGATISARPSDAIALALRTETPIMGEEDVLASVGISIPEEEDDEVEKFREFLDTISADDFAGSDDPDGESRPESG
jgi:bifunctional DNase/RNase